jgi:hypothetical protein
MSSDAWIPLMIGSSFTILACLKLYGLARGIMGGRAKPLRERLCGT